MTDSLSIRRAFAALPFPLLYRLYPSWFIQIWVRLFGSPVEVGFAPLREHDQYITSVLRDSIARRGGYDACTSEFARLAKYGDTTPLALATVNDHSFSKYVAVSGYEEAVGKYVSTGTGTLVLQPFVGPYSMAFFHLLRSGVEIADVGTIDPAKREQIDGFVSWITSRPRSAFNSISKGPQTAAEVFANLRQGRAVLWPVESLEPVGVSRSVEVAFLGRTVRVASLPFYMARRGHPIAVARSILGRSIRPAVAIDYLSVAGPMESETEQTFMQRLYSLLESEVFLPRVDQAKLWHWYPGVGPTV